jgi:hypothetical protein
MTFSLRVYEQFYDMKYTSTDLYSTLAAFELCHPNH